MTRPHRAWSINRRWRDRPKPYEVPCNCGRIARGTRKVKHQVVTCEGCKEPVFVLPFSPLPAVLGAEDSEVFKSSTGSKSPGRRLSPWLAPVLAGIATLLIVVVGFAFFFWHGGRTNTAPTQPVADTFEKREEQGRKLLSQGKYRLALQEFDAAQALLDRNQATLSAAERREWNQRYRQARTFANLLPVPINEVLRQAAEWTQIDDQEWQQHVKNYLGKTVLFDAEVKRSGTNKFLIDYEVNARGKPARLDFGLPRVFQSHVFLGQPQRLFFGAAIQAVRFESQAWVVVFDPESVVLITDLEAALECLPIPRDELQRVLEMQAKWLES